MEFVDESVRNSISEVFSSEIISVGDEVGSEEEVGGRCSKHE